VDSLITIPNDRLLALASKKATFIEMLKKADEVLYYAVKGISDLIMVPGLINLDFADVKAVMSEMGLAMMGTGIARGETRAREAAMAAITSPLLEDVSIDGAKGVLLNITCSPDLTIDEVSEAATTISEAADENAKIYFGTVFDPDAGDEMRITVIATGIESKSAFLSTENEKGNMATIHSLSNSIQGKKKSGGDGPGPGGGGGGGGEVVQRPRADVPSNEDDLNIPAYIRNRKRGGVEACAHQPKAQTTVPSQNSGQSNSQSSGHNPGQEDFIFEEEDFEIPSFIRMQAD
jgi:cell division protein FtsZ